jgi:hypothetical protein
VWTQLKKTLKMYFKDKSAQAYGNKCEGDALADDAE